jgi:hypothetical protein
VRVTSQWAVRCVSAALVLQLTAAAAALAGPWALEPAVAGAGAVAPVPGPPVAADQPAADLPAPAGPVVLSAPELWPGAVELRPLGLAADGTLQVPDTAAGMGWWAAGPRPGEPGAAVVVGHVDLDGEPGVFARLDEATPGALVVVGSGAVRYRVVSVERYSKADFPTDLVYAQTAGSELRLITCGGRYDDRTGHYEDNVVVRAVRA